MSESAYSSFTISWALAVLRGHKGLATMVFLSALAGAMTFAMSLPDIYRSTATVLVEHPGTPEGAGRPPVAVDLETRLQTIGQEVLSHTRLLALMERFDLYPELRERGAAGAAVERLRQDVQVKLLRGDPTVGLRTTVAFSISVRSRYPETAAQVANALATFYIAENAKIRERQGNAARLVRLGQELAQMQEVYTSRYPDVVRLKAEIAAVGHAGAKPSPAIGEEFRMLDTAIAAQNPAAPQRSRFVLLGIALAVGAAVGAVALTELLRPSFHTPEELQAFTAVPVLASIPRIAARTTTLRPRWRGLVRVAVGVALVVFVSYQLASGNEQLAWFLSRTPP